MSKKEYPAKLTTGYYRVREVWEDEASQFGAYRLLANAKAKCDENPGSRVFDNDGNVIYPEEAVPDTGADENEEKAVVDDIPEDKPETTTPVEDIPAEKEAEDEVDENEFPTAEEPSGDHCLRQAQDPHEHPQKAESGCRGRSGLQEECPCGSRAVL